MEILKRISKDDKKDVEINRDKEERQAFQEMGHAKSFSGNKVKEFSRCISFF
jgi:hypothetical protein